MRVKTKIEASPPKQVAAPASAEAKRSRPSPKMTQSPKRQAIEPVELSARGDAFADTLQVSLGAHSSASHNWKQPSRAHKAGGDWVCWLSFCVCRSAAACKSFARGLSRFLGSLPTRTNCVRAVEQASKSRSTVPLCRADGVRQHTHLGASGGGWCANIVS